MSKPFQPINEIINRTSKHKQQSFNELYGEPENFLEIEVRKILKTVKQKLATNTTGTKSPDTLRKRTIYGLWDNLQSKYIMWVIVNQNDKY